MPVFLSLIEAPIVSMKVFVAMSPWWSYRKLSISLWGRSWWKKPGIRDPNSKQRTPSYRQFGHAALSTNSSSVQQHQQFCGGEHLPAENGDVQALPLTLRRGERRSRAPPGSTSSTARGSAALIPTTTRTATHSPISQGGVMRSWARRRRGRSHSRQCASRWVRLRRATAGASAAARASRTYMA